jgi:hypothetical protein
MRGLRPLAIVLGGSIALLLSHAARGDGPVNDARSKKYAELVAQLVSPNKEPVIARGGESVTFPKGYDRAAQRRIEEAQEALHDNFVEALPYLIEASNDERYCMTIFWEALDSRYNYSVGEVCKDVIASQLEIYRGEILFSKPRWHKYHYPVSKAWRKTRKDRNLLELQVEAIDWAIELRRTEDEDERREEELAKLRALRKRITKSGKPAKSRRLAPMIVTDHE